MSTAGGLWLAPQRTLSLDWSQSHKSAPLLTRNLQTLVPWAFSVSLLRLLFSAFMNVELGK